ncbi:trichoplein keratin filament-binding protein [Anopheles ziemanni]|uniref:trichoplein keratin filament-binding protein n=1 Tax=Anopheles coustani TaxID=139045 RepID=UPI00265947DB|nr:trichoplein keratin filament-binding protein [Anopheles coustani]XP_058117247.1 trichoplein keratin filament-binding protein [Anopheles coustani]XP_058171796.1 trichoplein keratin filament-binding protein [Anopheles ziemanni]
MRSAKLQAALVKRREAEQIKYQKSAAVERYYDQWGRITSRYESWTTPQYYREAEEALRKREEEKRKATELQAKRERLKQMLQDEAEQLQKEVEDISRPKPKALSTEILEGVRARLHSAEESKKRLDLEANLYSKWRLGFDRDAVIMDSKTCHQAMAKLNWIDRQVEMQIQDEKNRREKQERELKLQEEFCRREELLLEKSRMREQEMKELRSMQEMHMAELKSREQEANELKLYEVRLKTKKDEMATELEQLRVYNDRRRDRVMAMHNLRRIKMLLRERSEAVRNDLRHDLQLLQRISIDNPSTTDSAEGIEYLRRKFQLQYDLEVEQQMAIENMYESEAKHNLSKWEDKWNSEAIIREQQLRCLLEDRLMDFEAKHVECSKRQRELIEVREQHLQAIESANQRLKELMSDKSRDEYVTSSNNSQLRELLVQREGCADNGRQMRRPTSQTSQRSSTFNSIFPFDDNFKELKLTKTLPRAETNTADELTVPRYGRKKVAWS